MADMLTEQLSVAKSMSGVILESELAVNRTEKCTPISAYLRPDIVVLWMHEQNNSSIPRIHRAAPSQNALLKNAKGEGMQWVKKRVDEMLIAVCIKLEIFYKGFTPT